MIINKLFEIYAKKKVKNPKLLKAARKIVKDLHNDHFNPKKKMGWDILFSHYVNDVFYEVYNEHLENYILKALGEKKCYGLRFSDKPHQELVIYRIKKKKKRAKRKQK